MSKSPVRRAHDKLSRLYPLGALSALVRLQKYLNENEDLMLSSPLPPRIEQLMLIYLGYLHDTRVTRIPRPGDESSLAAPETVLWQRAYKRMRLVFRGNDIAIDVPATSQIQKRRSRTATEQMGESGTARPVPGSELRQEAISHARAHLGDNSNIDIYISILKRGIRPKLTATRRTPMRNHQEAYEATVAMLGERFLSEIGTHAPRVNTIPSTLTRAVANWMLGEEHRRDGRARNWRVRLRLFDMRNCLDPEADSDPDIHPCRPGATVISGMPEVLKWISDLASHHHKSACPGLDQPTLHKKSRNLRTMMSQRGDGSGVLRAEYQVVIGPYMKHMIARCDVIQVGSASDITENTFST